MRNKFTLMLAAAVVVFAGFLSTITLEAAPRKVVIEDHTGAWCGYCTRGIENLEKLESKHGENVIGIGVHNTSSGRPDDMAISDYQVPLAQDIGVTGYPSGSVNRLNVGSKIAVSDTQWESITKSILGEEVPVGVKLDVDYNKATGEFTATITATVESDVNSQLAFNLWIVEDYMTGSGNGWNQQNYLSAQGGAPNPNSRFYNEPPVIVGFEHNNVFRAALGGIYGDVEGFPTGTTTAGTYTKTYTGNVSNLNVKNKNNAFFVAVVHNQATKEIINADRVGKVLRDYDELVASMESNYISLLSNEVNKTEITLTNEKSYPITANLSVNSSSSLIPNGWTTELSMSKVTVPANSSETVTINVNKNGFEGYAQLFINIVPEESNNIPILGNLSVYYMTENIENAYLFGYEDNVSYILSAINNSGVLSSLTPVAATPDVVANFPQMGNFKTAIFTTSDRTIAISNEQTKVNLNLLKTLMANGADILFTGVLDFVNYGGQVNQETVTDEARDFFSNTLGLNYSKFISLVANQNLYYLDVEGVNNDEISKGIQFRLNETFSQQTPVYAAYSTCFSFNGNTDATGFLAIQNPSSQGLTNSNNYVGMKLDKSGQRTVFVSIPLDPINNPNRDLLFKNILTWLKAEPVAAGPSLSLNVSQVKFGEVEVEETASETVQISNKGDEKLSITEINLLKGTNFEVKAGSLPITIDPGQTVNLTIEFTPSAKQNYTDEITFVSNDSENSETVLPVQGTGKLITSVPGQILNVFSMNVVPNPVTDNSVVNFNVKEGSSNVKLVLIDATGKVVSNLYDNVASGNQKVDLNASQLSSGSYYINADVDGITTQLPVVITK